MEHQEIPVIKITGFDATKEVLEEGGLGTVAAIFLPASLNFKFSEDQLILLQDVSDPLKPTYKVVMRITPPVPNMQVEVDIPRIFPEAIWGKKKPGGIITKEAILIGVANVLKKLDPNFKPGDAVNVHLVQKA